MRLASPIVIGLLLSVLAGAPGGWARDTVPADDLWCRWMGDQSPAPPGMVAMQRNALRAAVSQRSWILISAQIWGGADPDWLRHTSWYKPALKEALNRDLARAAANGDEKLMLRLIQAGADVNAKVNNEESASSLIWAARCNRISSVVFLLRHGADVNVSEAERTNDPGFTKGNTPLFIAASNGNAEVVKILLANGANPNVRIKVVWPGEPEADGDTPLTQAATQETAAALLAGHADPDLRGLGELTPLMRAASLGDMERCKLLLSRGADPRLKNRDGMTAAELARQGGHHDIAELLKVPQ